MAWTVTRDKTVFGNKGVVNLKLTADSAEANISTGLKNIDHFTVGYASLSTVVGLSFALNSNSSGTASEGILGVSGFTSGDELYVTVYGTR